MLNNADYIVSSGADTRVLWGCVLDLVNALACIGTAVALFPVVKRQNEAVALGFVTSRVLEAAIILIGVVSSAVHRFRNRSTVPRQPPDYGVGGDRDRPDLPVGAVASVWLVVKGFKPSPITAGMAEQKVAT